MSYDIVREKVPGFVKRVRDNVIQGSNNTIIVLGTDRGAPGPATVDDGLGHAKAPGGGKGAGAIHIIAGRRDEAGNPDMTADAAYLYLSMKTDLDKNVGLESVGVSSGPTSAAVLKADCVRIIVRNDLKISLDGGSTYVVLSKDKVTVESKRVELGRNASKHLVTWEGLWPILLAHIHPVAGDKTGPSANLGTGRNASTAVGPVEVVV
jgi:hypothetical protein